MFIRAGHAKWLFVMNRSLGLMPASWLRRRRLGRQGLSIGGPDSYLSVGRYIKLSSPMQAPSVP